MHVGHVALLSLDSLVAGCALAPLLPTASRRLAAAGLFGTADAVASSLGALIVLPLGPVLAAAPALPALYAVYLALVTGLAGRGLLEKREGRALPILGALAAALSLDNALSPAVAHSPLDVAALGAGSAAAMLLGAAVGVRLLGLLPEDRRGAWLAAGVAASACLAVVG